MEVIRLSRNTFAKEFRVSTSRRFEVVPIMHLAEEALKESGIKNGILHAFLPHATAALITNEYEPRVARDYLKWLRTYVPPEADWEHNMIDNNAHAHIASALIGSSRTYPVINGRIVRGTWQELMLLELDGPRNRRVIIQIIGC